MAEQKKSTTGTPRKTCNNDGCAVVSKTTVTTYQNSKGVKRVIRETTSAPKAKKTVAKPTSKNQVKPTAKNNGGKK